MNNKKFFKKEMSQGNSLYSYLYLKQAKMSCFSFYLFSFSFYKIDEQDGGTSPAQRGRIATMGRGRWQEKRVRG
jgi:hypothetical protein